ncbi:MAG: hypothetical protein OXQ89_19245 [Rhodospirillaceae bacterium]|nr:hypothetical protein [Rhodospirillaceae bacterium]MDE0360605.1 hypothetical protein [Rhodospirillaceae bacterium]
MGDLLSAVPESRKLADLMLLDADPLEDISNTIRTSAVIVDGNLYDVLAIEVLLADVLASSNQLLYGPIKTRNGRSPRLVSEG